MFAVDVPRLQPAMRTPTPGLENRTPNRSSSSRITWALTRPGILDNFIANVETAIWFQHGTRDGYIVKPPPKRPALYENCDFCIHIRTRKIKLPLKSSALGMCDFSNQAI